MKNKYLELKKKHEEIIDSFPMAFAFSNKQFEEAKKKLGVTSNDELLSIPGGGMIRKSDEEEFDKMYLGIFNESEEAQKDDDYLLQGLIYELDNHEYPYSGDVEPALSVFGYSLEDLENDERLKRLLSIAKRKCYQGD